MNDHQRKMARKAGEPCGYRIGGRVGRFRRQAIAPVSGDAGSGMAEGGAVEGETITDPSSGERVYRTPARVRELQEQAQRRIEAQRRPMKPTGRPVEKPPADAGTRMASGGKVHKVMHELKHGELHSGSKHGPLVTNRKQAVAIALEEARKGKP